SFSPVRVGVYKSSQPSIDRGWTQWLLEQERETKDVKLLPDELIRSKELKSDFDSIIVPDQQARTILSGYRQGAMPPELTGGLGPEGVKALREYIESGGTVVFLNRASNFAIEQFKLPVRNVVAGLPRTEFYVPGSILRIELNTEHPLVSGSAMPKETIAWAEDSPVFEVADMPGASVPAANVSIVASYPADANPLLSGWLLGDEKIRGKAALVEVKMGEG